MALPTITERPTKDIILAGDVYPCFVSRWNALHNPVVYEITNDKWPVNSVNSAENITAQADDNGNVQFTIAGHPFNKYDWVTIENCSIDDYNGVWRIIDEAANTITLDLAYQAGAIGAPTATLYYQNYHTLVRVYAGIPSGHILEAEDPIVLVATIKGRPDDNNITKVDVSALARDHVNLLNDLGLIDNDTNLWTAIYIQFAESYDSSDGTDVTQHVSSYTDDSSELVYGVNAKMPFQNEYGGNMALYVANDCQAESFMTKFEIPRIWRDLYYDIAFIYDSDEAIIFVYYRYDSNRNLLGVGQKTISDFDEGIYRIQLNNLNYPAATDSIVGSLWHRTQLLTNSEFNATLNPWFNTVTGSAIPPATQQWAWVAGEAQLPGTDTLSQILAQTITIYEGFTYYYEFEVTNSPPGLTTLRIAGYNSSLGPPSWITEETITALATGTYSGSFVTSNAYTQIGFWVQAPVNVTVHITSFFLEGFVQITPDKTFSIDGNCERQSIYLTWLNNLGGWDYWNFTAEKEYGIAVEDSDEFDANLEWDSEFINGETITALEFVKARNTRTVISQWLTQDEVTAIANIKTSIRVQEIRSDGTKITVLVDKDSFKIRQDQQKLFTIEFTLRYTDLIPVQNA